MASDARFDFYERVTARTTDPAKIHLNGEKGTVLARTPTEEGDGWYYGVSMDVDHRCWAFFEHELVSTGEFAAPEDYFDGASVRVQVDEHGRGRVVPPPEATD